MGEQVGVDKQTMGLSLGRSMAMLVLGFWASGCGLGIDPFPNSPLFRNTESSLSGTVFFSGTDSNLENHLFQIRSGRIRKVAIPGNWAADKDIRNLTPYRGSLYFTSNQGGDGSPGQPLDQRLLRLAPDGSLTVYPFPLTNGTFLKVVGDRLYYSGLNVFGASRLFSWEGQGEPFEFPALTPTGSFSEDPLDPVLFNGDLFWAVKVENAILRSVVRFDFIQGELSLVQADLNLPESSAFFSDGVDLFMRNLTPGSGPRMDRYGGAAFIAFSSMANTVLSDFIESPGSVYFVVDDSLYFRAPSSVLVSSVIQKFLAADQIDPSDPSGDGVFSGGSVFFRSGIGTGILSFWSILSGSSGDIQAGAGTLSGSGYDPARLTAHQGTVCFTAESASNGRKLYCIQNGAPIQLPSTNGSSGDDPLGLLSTPSGLVHASLGVKNGVPKKQYHLSRDLGSSEPIPFDEEYHYGVGGADFPVEVAPPLLFP